MYVNGKQKANISNLAYVPDASTIRRVHWIGGIISAFG